MSAAASAANNTTQTMQGWTSSPDGRGSFDILWSCLATIFLSTWSAICLNVPEPSDTKWTHVKRKTWITIISILGPEFLLGFALGEWQSARESVAEIRLLRHDEKWTLKHAFFANMGGFVLRTKDQMRFFLDAKQIRWLLERRVVSIDHFEKLFILDSKTIDDRNKSDAFVRVLAMGQALWFCINIIARGVQGLAVTTMEITVIGIVVDSVLIYYFWKDKPADVESMEVVDIDMTLNELILLEEDEEIRSRRSFRTPLDFASRRTTWTFNLIYHYLINILKACLSPLSWLRRKKPRNCNKNEKEESSLGRRSDNDVLPVTGLALVIAMLATAAFMGTNFIAWNFHFPTYLEKLLWRVSSVGLVVVTGFGMPVAEFWYNQRGIERMQEKVRERRTALLQQEQDSSFESENGMAAKWTAIDQLTYRFRKLALRISNNSPDQDPNLDVSVPFALAGTFLFWTYFCFRTYVLVEDVIAFRAMPSGVFQTVEWWGLVPHIG